MCDGALDCLPDGEDEINCSIPIMDAGTQQVRQGGEASGARRDRERWRRRKEGRYKEERKRVGRMYGWMEKRNEPA